MAIAANNFDDMIIIVVWLLDVPIVKIFLDSLEFFSKSLISLLKPQSSMEINLELSATFVRIDNQKVLESLFEVIDREKHIIMHILIVEGQLAVFFIELFFILVYLLFMFFHFINEDILDKNSDP